MPDFDKHSEVAAVTIAKRFGGWKEALSSAGFDPKKARLTYQDTELIEELRKVARELGRTPYSPEFSRLSLINSDYLFRRFGSWKNACEQARLTPPVPKPPPRIPPPLKGQRKLKVSEDELRRLYQEEGLSASAIARKYGVSRTPVLRAMKDYGIQIKRLHYSLPRETTIETMVCAEMERRGITFAKQQVVDGIYLVDALILGARIVVECDGTYWHDSDEARLRDQRRDRYLQSRGYQVFRFPEAAIRADVGGCVQRIVDALIDRYKR